jgi:hypothetical protein
MSDAAPVPNAAAEVGKEVEEDVRPGTEFVTTELDVGTEVVTVLATASGFCCETDFEAAGALGTAPELAPFEAEGATGAFPATDCV